MVHAALTPQEQADADGTDRADIVRILLEAVATRIPAADPDQLVAIEADVRAEFGNRRVRINTRATYRMARERAAVLTQADNAGNAASNADLIRASGIPRASWYRLVKQRRV